MANLVIEKVSELYNSVVVKFQEISYFSDLLQKMEERTGIPRSYIATGIKIVLGALLVTIAEESCLIYITNGNFVFKQNCYL